MHDQGSRDYFERRAEQEHNAAEHAASEQSARPHREMADLYRKLASEGDSRDEDPSGSSNGALSSDFRLLP